ncbi:hypothetical protein ALC56_05172 [Trachymyrmex septentrionalis]|uniref:Mos1 transposase HTH domain-containing protein n=1 Tax=Trachymyrmex septentrionalis TaxID=34720 RepID=A0A195FIY6_9HYME|nr:hypothetical protein ALC56_05172 [Trachymyrmex septentrionalis]
MQRSLEQRYAIKFCVKLGKSATETLDMIKQAYPDVALARSGVFRWHQAFLESRKESDRRLSIRLIAQMLNLPKSVVHDIVTEHLNMRKMVPKMPSVTPSMPWKSRWQRCIDAEGAYFENF